MLPRGRSRLALGATVAALAVVSMPLAHCESQDLSARDAGSESDATVDATVDASEASHGICGDLGLFCTSDTGAPACAPDSGWQCAVDTSCASPTRLTGKVFDPAGSTPLANVIVFIPNVVAQLPPITPGAPTCGGFQIGDYVTATQTDSTGSFTLSDVPVGSAVPVTVQTGKWRRTVEVAIPKACSTTQVPDGTLHLPGRRADGDMPQMALLTGGADNLACFLAGIGVDPSEFTAPGDGGRVSVYRGVGGADLSNGTPGDCSGALCPLWSTTASLDAFDVLLLGCEGGENLQTKPASAIQSMHDWLTSGGKLFGVHSQDTWFASGPADFRSVATWVDGPEAGAAGPFQIDVTSVRGHMFSQWASAVGILDADGGLPLLAQDVATSVSGVNGKNVVGWIHDVSTAGLVDGSTFGGNVKGLSIGIPPSVFDGGAEEPPAQCGRAALTDIHPGGTAPRSPIPSTCAGLGLTPEERALEFLFFDEFTPAISGCGACLPPPPPPPEQGG
jgi:hypothetical protein